MEQKSSVHCVIPKKNSALNEISNGDLSMEIPFKTGHCTWQHKNTEVRNAYIHSEYMAFNLSLKVSTLQALIKVLASFFHSRMVRE